MWTHRAFKAKLPVRLALMMFFDISNEVSACTERLAPMVVALAAKYIGYKQSATNVIAKQVFLCPQKLFLYMQ